MRLFKTKFDGSWLGFLPPLITLGIFIGIRELLKETGVWNNPNFKILAIVLGALILGAIFAYYLYIALKYSVGYLVKTLRRNLLENKIRRNKIFVAFYMIIIIFALLGEASLTFIVGFSFMSIAFYLVFLK